MGRGTGAVLGLLLLLLGGCRSPATPPRGPRSAEPAVRDTLAEGDVLRRGGREEEALDLYRQAIDAAPTSVPAHLRYVATLLRLGRRSEARSIYAERVAAPGATDVDRVMAQRLQTNGSTSALRRVYTLAAQSTGDEGWWRLALAEVETAEAEAWDRKRREAIARGHRDGERSAHAQAQAALARATRAVERAREVAPDRPEVDLYLGYVRAVEGDLFGGSVASSAAYRAAEAAFRQAVAADPDLVEAWEGLGDVRLRVGDLAGSVRAWREAVERRPADAWTRQGLGLALQRAERLDEAAVLFEQAARLAPHDAMPWLRLGDVRADDGLWDEAIAAYRQALARDGDALEAWLKIGAVHEHLGRRGEARAAYERYVAQGGERAAFVRRRIERIVRAEAGP